MENKLKTIREEVEKHLKNGVVLTDVVYRPFDMEVFGAAGYTITLYKPPDRMRGIRFGKELPTPEVIGENVRRVVDRLSTL